MKIRYTKEELIVLEKAIEWALREEFYQHETFRKYQPQTDSVCLLKMILERIKELLGKEVNK